MNSALVIKSQKEDLGGFFVYRTLPSPNWRFVGPFVLFDHMGPLQNGPGKVIEVRPHPHIGLATVTYLFEGRIQHRDSLGSVQVITPGDLNWMTAGKGIVHSERTPKEDRNEADQKVTHGIQIWVALPKTHEECEPSFVHYEKEKMPFVSPVPSLKVKVMVGSCWGVHSPVKTFSSTLFMDFVSTSETAVTLPSAESEMGFYLISGSASINDQKIHEHEMLVLDDAKDISVKMSANSRMIVIGGEPLSERRYMWWNFVSSDRALIDKASEMWRNQNFPKVPGETEFTPLPTDPDA